MALRDGWLINENEDGEKLVFKLLNGAPYQVRVDPDGGDAPVLKLEPGYYDDELKSVSEDEAVAPEDEDEDVDELAEEYRDRLAESGNSVK